MFSMGLASGMKQTRSKLIMLLQYAVRRLSRVFVFGCFSFRVNVLADAKSVFFVVVVVFCLPGKWQPLVFRQIE